MKNNLIPVEVEKALRATAEELVPSQVGAEIVLRELREAWLWGAGQWKTGDDNGSR
jgi:hypothetical protein